MHFRQVAVQNLNTTFTNAFKKVAFVRMWKAK